METGNKILDKLLGGKCGQIIAWQLCSIIMFLSGTVCTFIVQDFGRTIPLLMLSITYFLILIINVWWWPKSEVSWWKYILIAICGLGGDWTAVLAYNTTSLASAMLLITTVIFWVAPLSYFVLGRKITILQGLSILIAAGGVSMVMVADGAKGSRLVGNFLSLASALCYAISTVTQEKVVNNESVRLYLCRFSVWAFPLAAVLSGAIEWKTISNYNWCWKSVLLIFAYAVLLALYYMLVPIILQYSTATLMNLSTLTSNFYSLAVSIIIFKSNASWLYLVGFAFIPISIAIYVLNEKKPESNPDATSISTDAMLNEEH